MLHLCPKYINKHKVLQNDHYHFSNAVFSPNFHFPSKLESITVDLIAFFCKTKWQNIAYLKDFENYIKIERG